MHHYHPYHYHCHILAINIFSGGEGDPYYVTSGLKREIENNGILLRVGNGKNVGNVAWAHIVANNVLARDKIFGGEVFFITDDTPKLNPSRFMEIFLKARGMSLSTYSIPYSFVYCIIYAIETFLHLISPIYKLNRSFIYVNRNLYFSRNKAERMFRYEPIDDFNN